MDPADTPTKIESIFVRNRNALLLRGQFTPLYIDYYLHLNDQKIRYTEPLDHLLKESLAMLSLHLTARPWSETHAWTMNLRAPHINLFVTGNSYERSVTGRIFTKDVREPDRNLFYSQIIAREGNAGRTSTMEIQGRDAVAWIEQFYAQSEQRPARAFRLPDENFVLITAQPDCDLEWLEALTLEDVQKMDENEVLSILETRFFEFNCGCTLDRILPVLAGWKDRKDELFGDDPSLEIECPRCASKYLITREMID